ncbi:MAG TPA: GNAT family N-acetyltransferase [Actinomycetota bacterium]
MDVRVRTDDAALEDLATEWDELWEADATASVFQSAAYARVAWETDLALDRDLVVVEAREAGRLEGLAALTADVDGVVEFLGHASVTDYLAPLCRVERRAEVAAALMAAAADLRGWRHAELSCLATDTGWPEALSAAARAAGMAAKRRPMDVCPRVALAGDYDAYLATLSSKLRHEIKRKARRLEREAGAFTVRSSDAARLDEDLTLFFAMHKESDGAKGKFMHDDMAVMFERLARAFQDRGWLRLVWLDVDGEPWASTLSFCARGVWSVYNSAFDHTKRELGPGMVLMAETIRAATEERCRVFDLLRGAEPYKYRFGAVDATVEALRVEHPIGLGNAAPARRVAEPVEERRG